MNIEKIKREGAVNFAEWIGKEGYQNYDGFDRWIAPQNNRMVYSTFELYDLYIKSFKNKTFLPHEQGNSGQN